MLIFILFKLHQMTENYYFLEKLNILPYLIMLRAVSFWFYEIVIWTHLQIEKHDWKSDYSCLHSKWSLCLTTDVLSSDQLLSVSTMHVTFSIPRHSFRTFCFIHNYNTWRHDTIDPFRNLTLTCVHHGLLLTIANVWNDITPNVF